jgi:hypothetical protein
VALPLPPRDWLERSSAVDAERSETPIHQPWRSKSSLLSFKLKSPLTAPSRLRIA